MDWCSLLCRYGTSREEIVLFFFRSGGHRRLNGGASGQEFCCHIKFAVDTTHLREREPPRVQFFGMYCQELILLFRDPCYIVFLRTHSAGGPPPQLAGLYPLIVGVRAIGRFEQTKRFPPFISRSHLAF